MHDGHTPFGGGHSHDHAPRDHEHTPRDHEHAPRDHEHTEPHPHEPTHPHEHSHTEPVNPEKTGALLSYMLKHNREHAQELEQLKEQLTALGKDEAARLLNIAIEDYNRGSSQLEAAIAAAK